jgi:hypothetical protein
MRLKNVCRAVAVLSAAVALTPETGAAQWWQGQSLCSTSQLSVCASVSVTPVGGTFNQLTVTVTNTGTNGTLFTIGMFYYPEWNGTWDIVSATKTGVGDVTSQWREGTNSLNNYLDWGVVRQGSANNGIQVGQTVVFVITFTPGFTVDANTQLAWHAGQLQVSEKCVTGEVGSHACVPVTTVPEPITVVLIGSGLAGIGVLRRRRKGLDVTNA